MATNDISRRMFLASIPALAAALSNVDLNTETVRVLLPEVAAPVDSVLKKFMVTFPDGATMSFEGFVTQVIKQDTIDSITTVSMDVLPTGEVVSTPATPRVRRRGFRPENEVTVTHNGETLGDVLSIEAPHIERTLHEVYYRADEGEPTFIEGIKRYGPMRLELAWDRDFDIRKLME